MSQQHQLKVVIRTYPESNGNRNWTALLMREGEFDGLIGNGNGITVGYSKMFYNRVALEAARTEFLLGIREDEPNIMDYLVDVETKEEFDKFAFDRELKKELRSKKGQDTN